MENKNYCVYMHTSPSGKRYIGITNQTPEKRWQNGYGYTYNSHFYRAIKHYGWENFKHEILNKNLTMEEAQELEIKYIAMYNTTNQDNGYNHTNGGEHKGKWGIDARERMSKAHKGKKLSPEHRKKIAEKGKGRVFSEETRRKIGDSHRGIKMSDEAKKRMSEKAKGRIVSEETRKKISRAGKGRKFSNETIIKLRNANRLKKKVLCVETGIVYDSMADASRATGAMVSHISTCCNKKAMCKTAGGFHWEFVLNEIA